MGTSASSPIIFRAYKKEAEFEIWKQKSDGQYALLKTYPMCRWSGQLGPKKREGDRQVPEGFYTITPGQMNPNSNYYLSFNVGYPNAYDRAWDRAGGNIMVHGICSSAGCFSMTDPQIAEIYALAREAFNGGQREIQFQSYPFRMTTREPRQAPARPEHRVLEGAEERLRPFRGDEGGSAGAGLRPPLRVRRQGRRRIFRARRLPAADPRRSRRETDGRRKGEQGRGGRSPSWSPRATKPIRLVYDDGGQNPVFAGKFDASRPDALAQGPREIVLDNKGKPLPAAVEVASADARASAASPARRAPSARARRPRPPSPATRGRRRRGAAICSTAARA